MLKPAKIDIRADRHVPFVRVLAFVGFDFTGATFKMEVRRYNDEPGTALLTLTTQTTDVQGVRLAYAASDTVQNHIAAGRLRKAPPGLDASTAVWLSQVKIRIDKTNVVGLPSPEELGEDWDGAWDLHITPSGGDEDRYAGGKFAVEAGATV